MRLPDSESISTGSRPAIDPFRLAFDIDGVVADTMRLFLDICRGEHGLNHLRYEDITDWDLSDTLDIETEIVERIVTQILDGDYRMPLHPLDGAAGVLDRLGRHCGSLLMVTARPHPGPIEKWFHQQLTLAPAMINIICTGSFDAKADVLREHDKSYFVEDRLDTCFMLDEAGLTPVLFRQPWNRQRHPFFEVGTWQELESLIAF